MNSARKKSRVSWPIIYGAGIALIFLLGAMCGSVISGWWGRTPSPSVSVLVTVIPSPTRMGLAGTPSPDGEASSGFCPPPTGWVAYTIQPGDTLTDLADRTGVNPEIIQRANCLTGSNIFIGGMLFLPPVPTPTPCPPAPLGWESYIVQEGDWLNTLAKARGTDYQTVMQINCLTSDIIKPGERLFLPALPTPTQPPPPLPSPTPGFIPAESVALAVQPSQSYPDFTLPILLSQPSSSEEDIPPVDDNGYTVPAASLEIYGPGDIQEGDDPPCRQNSIKLYTFTTDLFDRVFMELGQRRHFYVCNFDPISAIVIRDDGLTQPVELFKVGPDPDQPLDQRLSPLVHKLVESTRLDPNPGRGKVHAVIAWSALPFYPTGDYSLVVTGTQNISIPVRINRDFVVNPPTQEHILPIPAAGSPETNFLVYYVYFDLKPHQFNLLYYNGDQTILDQISRWPHRTAWEVSIDQPLVGVSEPKGWGVEPLPLDSTNLRATYVITSANAETYTGVWIK